MQSLVQQAYRSRMDALTPKERMARCTAMLEWTRSLLRRQILEELGSISEERLKWEVAKRMYGGDPTARAFIDRKLDHVSD